MNAEVAASATGMVSSSGSAPIPTATPPMTGRNVAAVAVLLVSSVRKITAVVITATSSRMARPCRLCAWVPIHSVSPEELNCEDSARPPPNSNNTPHGSCTAVDQSSSRTPSFAPAGRMNSNTPAAIAMPASEMGGSSQINGNEIQLIAARAKITATRRSPPEGFPSLASSVLNSLRPPGSSSISGLKISLANSTQVMTSRTLASGSPSSIHRPKLMSMPCSSCR